MKFTNPFADLNSNYLSDDEIFNYWIRPERLFKHEAIGIDLLGKIPVVIMGGRGTGKTMLLRYLSYDLQLKDFMKKYNSYHGFLEKTPYIGFYYRFDGPKLSSFSNKNVDDIIWETIFSSFVELIIGQKYLTLIKDLRRNGVLSISDQTEMSLCHSLSEALFEKSYANNLVELSEILIKLQREIERFTEKSTFKKIEFSPSEVIIRESIIFELPKMVSTHVSELQNKNVLVLLDEYENLSVSQQKTLNTYIKHTKQPVTFRVGMRIKGFRTYETLNENEFLREGADFREILFENFLLSKSSEYRKLIKKIANRRLELHPWLNKLGFTEIDEILGETPSPEVEARNLLGEKKKGNPHLVRARKYLESKGLVNRAEIERIIKILSYPENPLVEMLNILLLIRGKNPEQISLMKEKYRQGDVTSKEYSEYKLLYDKNKVALLFHLARDCRKAKKYYGFEAFCMLSSGIIRSFLELCYHTFNYAIFNELDNLMKSGKISSDSQERGILREVEDFFDWIRSIPVYGSKVTLFIDSLGALFRSLHYADKRLSEPEPTYFNTEYDTLSAEAKKVLDTAIMWSILQQKEPMQTKTPTEILPDVYALNRILAPRYRISYRTRGRTKIKPDDLEILLLGEEEEKMRIFKKYSKESYQKLLFDVAAEDT